MIKKYILKYKKESEPIRALEYTGDNYDEVLEFIGSSWGEIKYAPKEWFVGFQENVLEFRDETGAMYCYIGDYIIDVGNDKSNYYRFFPCRKHTFEKYHEQIT